MTSHDAASADALLTANAELRAALDVAMAENEARIGLERRLVDERDQALAKVEGLNLAADQYSASRDQWMLKAKRAEAVVSVAREWMDAVETLDGVYAAEQALLAVLKASSE